MQYNKACNSRTNHWTRILKITCDNYLYTVVAPPPISWSDFSSVWEATAVWHDGQC